MTNSKGAITIRDRFIDYVNGHDRQLRWVLGHINDADKKVLRRVSVEWRRCYPPELRALKSPRGPPD